MSYYFALFLALFESHTVRLDFKPAGQIVMLNYENTVVYTDTAALFSVYEEHGDMPAYYLRIVQLIRKKTQEVKNDTVSFSENFVPFYGYGNDDSQDKWAVGWAVTHLLNENKLSLFDKNNILVRNVSLKAVGRKRKHWAAVKIVYINMATKEELFSEGRYLRRREQKLF